MGCIGWVTVLASTAGVLPPVLFVAYILRDGVSPQGRAALSGHLGIMAAATGIMILCVCAIVAGLLSERGIRKRLLADRCGACDYSLAAVEPQADRCRVCPECGAAWRQATNSDAGPAA
jgi:hypothetical protein